MGDVYDPFEKHGLKRVINAATCLTRLGGSIPDPRVCEAMNDASKAYVQIPQLQAWAGKQIAKATGAEAGLPAAGAVNALTLAAAACIMKDTELEEYDPLGAGNWTHLTLRLPMHTEGLRTEFVVQKECRNHYDHAVECAGGRMVEVESTPEALEAAYHPERTAAYYFTVRESRSGLSLEAVLEVAHRNGIPVIVDAAPDLRPKGMFKYHISKGADLVVFSGGKHLGGPNNSGILAGRGDLIKLAHLQAYPFDGIGRGSKMSRETIVGLVEAIRLYSGRDDEAELRLHEERARSIADQLSKIPGVEAGVTYEYTMEENVPMGPFAYVSFNGEVNGVSLRGLHRKLLEGDPAIETLYEPAFLIDDYKGKLTMKTEYMLPGDDAIVVQRIKAILKAPG